MSDTNYVRPGDVPADFWAAALNASAATGVDPYLIAAIGDHETQWGRNPDSYPGFSMGYGDYGPGANNKVWKYADNPGEYTNQTMAAAKQIAGYLGGQSVTEDSLHDFQVNSWKPGDQNWYKGVWSAYVHLNKEATGGDPNYKVEGGTGDTTLTPTTSTAASIGGGILYIVILIIIAVVGMKAFEKALLSNSPSGGGRT